MEKPPDKNHWLYMLYVIKIIRNQEEREKRKMQSLGNFPLIHVKLSINSVSYDFMFFKVKNNEDTIINGYKISLHVIRTKTVNLWRFHAGREQFDST